jgi:serine/threonine protein phosphatase PrpC
VRAHELGLGDLLNDADEGPVDLLPAALERSLSRLGARRTVLYLSDYGATELKPARGSPSNGATPSPIDIEGTPAGRAFQSKEVVEDPATEGQRLWAPVTERSEPLGVVELEFDSVFEVNRRIAHDVGRLVGHLLVTARGYTDVYEMLRRRRDMSLAAEMHWDVLPARNFHVPSLSICADIEPAYDVGGDAFDYSLNNGTLDVGIMDAMGHGLEAALLCTQAVAAYRYARRRRAPLNAIAETIDDTLARQFGGARFVTGFFARFDWSSGHFEWVSAGHVPPLVLRSGKVDSYLDLHPCCPMGLGYLDEVTVSKGALREGDCLVLYSDGVIDSRTPEGELFTLERLADLVEGHDVQAGGISDVVHKVIEEVTLHSGGPLRDDATCVLVQYKGQTR